MDHLSHFHYDAPPFSQGEPAYVHDFRAQERAVSGAATLLRFQAGIVLIRGKERSGKSLVLSRIEKLLSNGALILSARGRADQDIIFSLMASADLPGKRPDPDKLYDLCLDARRGGMDVVFIADDIDSLNSAEAAGLAVLLERLPFARIAAGIRDEKAFSRWRKAGLKTPLLATFVLPRVSFLSAARYLRAQSERALSLASSKNPMTRGAAAVLALCANRSLSELNKMAEEAAETAAREGRARIGAVQAIRAARKHPAVARENLYFKAQKAFVYLLLGLIAYFAGLALYERYSSMREEEAKKDLRWQEKLLD